MDISNILIALAVLTCLTILVLIVLDMVRTKKARKWYSLKEESINYALRQHGISIESLSDEKYKFHFRGELYYFGKEVYKSREFNLVQMVSLLKKLENNSCSEIMHPIFKEEYEKNIIDDIDKVLYNGYRIHE